MRKLLIGASIAVLCSLSAPAPAASIVPDGTITAVAPLGCADANAVVITASGFNSFGLSVSTAFQGNLQVAATIDGIQFSGARAVPLAGGAPVSSITSPGQWIINGANFLQLCIYATDLSSGTPVISLSRSMARPGAPVADLKPPGIAAGGGDTAQVVVTRDSVRVQVVTQPLNPLLSRCNAVRTTQCQP